MDVKNNAIKASNQRSNCPHDSLILFIRCSKGPCANVNGNHCHFRDEKSLKKLEFSQVLPRNIVRQRVSANLSRLEIRTWQTRLRSRHICSAFSHLVVEITGNHYNGRFTLTSLITGDQHRR